MVLIAEDADSYLDRFSPTSLCNRLERSIYAS
jgi:hypothetical protein